MSDAGKPPRLPRNRAAFVRNRVRQSAHKQHNYDARNYHQNANRHGIHALTTFTCPICQCKNTVRVELNRAQQLAVVKCSYCVSLEPRPVNLPYPFVTPFVPKLENKADAFFRFSEAYRRLLNKRDNDNDNNNDDDDDADDEGNDDVAAADDDKHDAPHASPLPVTAAQAADDDTPRSATASDDAGDATTTKQQQQQQSHDNDDAKGDDDDDAVDDVTAFFDGDD